jgi:hypothetical protein
MRVLLLLTTIAAAAPVGAQTYRVYPLPVESPHHTTPLPPADARALLVDPSNADASPFGWHDTNGAPGPEETIAAGNNAVAYFDVNGNTLPDPGESPDGGAGLAFDFPLDLTHPIDFEEALSTNAFYWSNLIHDIAWHHGFTEAAGNFQENNYGRGGLGGDRVRVLIPAGGGGGATMSAPPDGQAPRLVIGGFIPTRPGSLDAGVLLHEMAHGISSRLTGGPSNSSCLGNAEQGGEGWSDFYGLMLTMRPDHTGAGGRTVGTWIVGEGPDGDGVRPEPYSTDFAVNDYTYGDTQTAAAPHGVGFVWMTILWEVLWELIAASGYDADLYNGAGTAGNQMMLSLVTHGLILQPCQPGFVDARDAILAADQVLYDGGNTERLWQAFARRGLGFSASQGSSSTNSDNLEAFDVPTTANEPPSVPLRLAMGYPSPNPVVTNARVSIDLPAGAVVRLALHDLLGREVGVLLDGHVPAGRHEAMIATRDLEPGVYVLQLVAGGDSVSRRVTIAGS